MDSAVRVDWITGALSGTPVRHSVTKLSRIRDLFHDRARVSRMDPETIIYSVEYWMPVAENTPGGLFWGTTVLQPGRVGDEYFMTHGHFHAVRDRAEYYVTVRGEGALILMDESGACRYEPMMPGSVHYIPGRVAHRAANTGSAELAFVACWPSDAGYDYEIIRTRGFSARMREVEGRPVLIPEPA